MARLHSNHANIYFNCYRCGYTRPLAHARWQNGQLYCSDTDCIDTAIIGSRDINVARAVAIWRHELEPDRKLTEAADRKTDMNEIMY